MRSGEEAEGAEERGRGTVGEQGSGGVGDVDVRWRLIECLIIYFRFEFSAGTELPSNGLKLGFILRTVSALRCGRFGETEKGIAIREAEEDVPDERLAKVKACRS